MFLDLLSRATDSVAGWVGLVTWITTLLLVLIALKGPAHIPTILLGLGRLLGLLFTGPLRFLRMIADGLISGGGSSQESEESGSFLLVRVGRLLYVGILLVTVTILTAGLYGTFEASFPSDLREWRAEAQEERKVLRETLVRTQQRLDSLEALAGDTEQIVRNRQQLNEDISRLRSANQRGFDLRQRPGYWNALVEDFYREAWRTYTDGRDNLFTNPDRLASHRAAIERWDERIQSLLDESGIDQANVEATRSDWPRIVEYGLGRLAQMDTLAAAVLGLEEMNNLDRTLQEQRRRVENIEFSIEDLTQALSENGLFSSVSDGFAFILFVLLVTLLWIWVAGVAVESLMLVVGINRDIRSIRAHLESPPAQAE